MVDQGWEMVKEEVFGHSFRALHRCKMPHVGNTTQHNTGSLIRTPAATACVLTEILRWAPSTDVRRPRSSRDCAPASRL